MATSLALSSVTTTLAPKTFLQHCEEELNPELLNSFDKKSTLWKVAAVATLVAFTVLMVGAFVAAGLYAPVFIPIIGISSLILLSQINKVYHTFNNWSTQAFERAEQLREINNHFQSLANSTPVQLQQILNQKGILNIPGMQRNDPQLTTLKPLIARHMFWEGQVEKLQKNAAEKLTEASKLASESYADNKDEIFELRSEALEWEKEALESKCKNAFINAVIRRPQFLGTIEDLGSFSELSGQERAVANANNIANANDFFTFKGRNLAHIRFSDSKQYSVSDLAQRMLAAMPT